MPDNDPRGLDERVAAAISTITPALVAVHGTANRQTASGVAWSPDGLVVTTHSGTWDDEGVQVTLPSGQRHPALVLGRDPTTDLLVLQVAGLEEGGERLATPTRADLAALTPGRIAIAVGRLARGTRAAWGPVTEVGGAWTSPLGGRIDGRIVVDAPLPRGLTGGALVDIEGRLVGLNTRRLDRGGTTIPAATVDRVVERIRAGGDLRPGWLGVAVLPVALPRRLAEALEQEHGLIVLGVDEGGPAAAAGVLQGDVLLRLGDQPLVAPSSLKAALGPDTVGTAAPLALIRAGERVQAELTPAPRPAGAGRQERPPWGHHHGAHAHRRRWPGRWGRRGGC